MAQVGVGQPEQRALGLMNFIRVIKDRRYHRPVAGRFNVIRSPMGEKGQVKALFPLLAIDKHLRRWRSRNRICCLTPDERSPWDDLPTQLEGFINGRRKDLES